MAIGGESLLQRWVIDGGFMMVALVPTAILTVAYSIQGFLNLRRSRVCPDGFVRQLTAIREGSGVEAARQSLTASRSSIAVILLNTLSRFRKKPDADPEELLRDEILNECDLLIQQNAQLGIIYILAPMMGLLGTVFGMLKTFGEFMHADKPSITQLGGGISVAFICTTWGLAIAIPAYLAISLIRAKIGTYETMVLPHEGTQALAQLLEESA